MKHEARTKSGRTLTMTERLVERDLDELDLERLESEIAPMFDEDDDRLVDTRGEAFDWEAALA